MIRTRVNANCLLDCVVTSGKDPYRRTAHQLRQDLVKYFRSNVHRYRRDLTIFVKTTGTLKTIDRGEVEVHTVPEVLDLLQLDGTYMEGFCLPVLGEICRNQSHWNTDHWKLE